MKKIDIEKEALAMELELKSVLPDEFHIEDQSFNVIEEKLNEIIDCLNKIMK